MAWKITRDFLDGADSDAVGRGQGDLTGETFTFRLLDDDGELYYLGVADAAAAADDEVDGGLYIALKWAEGYAGCTDLEVRGDVGIKHGLTSQSYLDATKRTPADWVPIYG